MKGKYIHVCAYKYTYTNSSLFIYLYIHVSLCIRIFAYMNISIYIYVYIYIYVLDVNINVHTHMPAEDTKLTEHGSSSRALHSPPILWRSNMTQEKSRIYKTGCQANGLAQAFQSLGSFDELRRRMASSGLPAISLLG